MSATTTPLIKRPTGLGFTKLRFRSKHLLYLPLAFMAIFYLLPVYVMLITGFKGFEEVSLRTMWDLPSSIQFDNFIEAYKNLAPALWNSFNMVIPAALISSFLGSINGFVLAKWKFRGADLIFPLILFGMFIPYQSILIPLVEFMRSINLYGGLPGLVLTHVIYGIPITTLTFRNYYATIPKELVEAGRMDGTGLLGSYWYILLPLSLPSFVVVIIWQFTSAWNDFLFAVVLTSPSNWPITVALNNMAGSQIIAWNVQMAGSLLAALPVLPTKDEPRWIQDEARFKDELQAAGYSVEILFSQGDSAKEKANVEALITKGVKVIIICPQDGNAAAAAVEEARKAGVKVISYDRLITGTDAVDFYVTFDSVAVGMAQGQYLIDKASGSGNPLYLYAGAASDNNAFLFFEGAWSVLQPKIADGTFVIKNSSEAVALQDKAVLTRDEQAKIIGQITTNWDFNVAKNLAEANLTSAAAADKGDVLILAPNDGTARAIADTFAADGDVSSFVVTGQDAEKASVQYIIDGKQSMTVFKDVRTLVKDAIGMAVSLLEGNATPPPLAHMTMAKSRFPPSNLKSSASIPPMSKPP
jgi:putative multiple sugar transport system substrate-binding protein